MKNKDYLIILMIIANVIYFTITILISIKVKTTESVLRSIMSVQVETAKTLEMQTETIEFTLENTLVFQRQYRIPVCELIIKDCIEKENFELAKYWEDYKKDCINQAKEQGNVLGNN